MASKGSTAARVIEIIKPYADELGLDIWDVRYTKEGADRYLRIFIDKAGGVSVDDCVELTHAVSKPLDNADPIPDSYYLEISSPGIERELINDEHFNKFIGADITLRTIRPVSGVRDFAGILTAYENGKLTIEQKDGTTACFNKKDTSYVKLDDFDINDFKQEIK